MNRHIREEYEGYARGTWFQADRLNPVRTSMVLEVSFRNFLVPEVHFGNFFDKSELTLKHAFTQLAPFKMLYSLLLN